MVDGSGDSQRDAVCYPEVTCKIADFLTKETVDEVAGEKNLKTCCYGHAYMCKNKVWKLIDEKFH